MRRALLLAWLGAAACGAVQEEAPCHRAVRQVREWESARVHGLTESDDVREAAGRLQDALACATGEDRADMDAHARLLATRLLARGAHAEALGLARALGEHPLSSWIRAEVSGGSAAMEGALRRHAERMTASAPGPRAVLAARAWKAEAAAPVEAVSVVLSFVTDRESCLVVVPADATVEGAWRLGVGRGGRELPLHGDAPAVTWRRGHAEPVRLCAAEAFRDGDVAWASVEGRRLLELSLVVDDDARARGRAWDVLSGRIPDDAPCARAREPDARAACALGGG